MKLAAMILVALFILSGIAGVYVQRRKHLEEGKIAKLLGTILATLYVIAIVGATTYTLWDSFVAFWNWYR